MIKGYNRKTNLKIIQSKRSVYDNRYQTYNCIIDFDDNKTYLESANNFNLSNTVSKYHVVEPIEEGRLDMISQIYYGDPQLYWVIALANNIIDPFTVMQGSILKIPEYNELYYIGGPLVKR